MTPDPSLLDAYERETRPSPGRVDRVAAAVLRPRSARASTPRRLVYAGAALLLLGGVALGPARLGSSRVDELALETPPPAAPSVPAPSGAVAPAAEPGALSSPDAPATRTLDNGVVLTWQGTGRLGPDAIAWEAGALQVEVPPNRGIELSVQTREATTRVVGTGFTVTRNELGTDVEVQHGRVEVRCAGSPGSTAALDAGDRLVCPPVSPAGLLARARGLRERGAPAAEIRGAIDAGLDRVAPGDPTAGELRYLRAEVAYAAGDYAGARADLDAYLASGADGRAGDTLRLSAALALEAGDCAAARPALESLVTTAASPADLVRLGDCLADDPERARAAFVRALALSPDPVTESRARAGLARLDP